MAPSLPLALVLVTVLILTAPPSSSAAVISKRSKSPPSSLTGDANTANKSPSSAVFPIKGNVYPNGLYYASMLIGNPPKPYFLEVDTGSDLLWLQCDAPCASCSKVPHPLYKPMRNSLVPCKDPLCAALHESTHRNQQCKSPGQCDYEIQYADKGSSLGVLVSDASVLRLTNSSIVRPQLEFGCGYDQHPNSPSPTDGVLGLGRGQISIISQLTTQGVTRNVIGHCLSRSGGFLFFGDDLVPSQGVTWASMSPIPSQNHYSPGKASFFLGNKTLGITESQPVVFDSGSSYTYFTNQPYQQFLSALKNGLSNKPLKEAVGDPALPICWKGTKPFKSLLDVKNLFTSLFLNFVNGAKTVQMEIPPENYLIITKLGNACLGILNGTEVGLKDLNIIGDISMQDLAVIYDNEKQQIGWARANCNRRLPKSGTSLL